MKKAVFLDRDGVLNRKAPEGQYIMRWEDMVFLPRVREAVRLFNQAGFLVVVVSNQRCVAKGLITTSELDDLHARMQSEFALTGARLDAIYYCPHENEPPCACRKPQPGLLLQAARIHNIDLAKSWMIGDSKRDVAAGRAAGCRTVRLTEDKNSALSDSDWVAFSLLDATHKLLQVEASLQPLAATEERT
jgi:D-glycero-D-manno-heptose 1,7-bisphosphate phosphatase